MFASDLKCASSVDWGSCGCFLVIFVPCLLMVLQCLLHHPAWHLVAECNKAQLPSEGHCFLIGWDHVYLVLMLSRSLGSCSPVYGEEMLKWICILVCPHLSFSEGAL